MELGKNVTETKKNLIKVIEMNKLIVEHIKINF
jgi:hypothetical protein